MRRFRHRVDQRHLSPFCPLPPCIGGELCSLNAIERDLTGTSVQSAPLKAPRGPFLWGLIPELCETRRICHYIQSLLPPFYDMVDSISFLCDFFYYPQFLLILWLPGVTMK